jgi:NAD(P)-dependent dehydrogenase (short-subunit alcohol dehydrogenase family)
MLLENKVVIVTGAASPRGIGKATAKALAAQGARIVIRAKKTRKAPLPISAPLIWA